MKMIFISILFLNFSVLAQQDALPVPPEMAQNTDGSVASGVQFVDQVRLILVIPGRFSDENPGPLRQNAQPSATTQSQRTRVQCETHAGVVRQCSSGEIDNYRGLGLNITHDNTTETYTISNFAWTGQTFARRDELSGIALGQRTIVGVDDDGRARIGYAIPLGGSSQR